MASHPAGPEIERLIQLLAKLPGLGPRSARRAALALLKKREALLEPLGTAMRDASAAIKVCGDGDTRQLKVAMAVKACEDQAVERSVLAVNNVQLTQVANEHGLGVRTGITVAAMR